MCSHDALEGAPALYDVIRPYTVIQGDALTDPVPEGLQPRTVVAKLSREQDAAAVAYGVQSPLQRRVSPLTYGRTSLDY